MPITIRSTLPVVLAVFCHLIAQESSGETAVQPMTLKHTSKVKTVAFSPDGKTLAAGSEDGSITLWDVETRKERRCIKAHKGIVVSVAFNPKGKSLASGGSQEKLARLWDIESGKEQLTFEADQATAGPVAFSPDGQTLATGGYSGTVKLWEMKTGMEKTKLKGHTDTNLLKVVTSLVFSNDGKLLASGSWDQRTKLWEVASGRERAALSGPAALVHAVVFSPDGKTLATAYYDGTWPTPKSDSLSQNSSAQYRPSRSRRTA